MSLIDTILLCQFFTLLVKTLQAGPSTRLDPSKLVPKNISDFLSFAVAKCHRNSASQGFRHWKRNFDMLKNDSCYDLSHPKHSQKSWPASVSRCLKCCGGEQKRIETSSDHNPPPPLWHSVTSPRYKAGPSTTVTWSFRATKTSQWQLW